LFSAYWFNEIKLRAQTSKRCHSKEENDSKQQRMNVKIDSLKAHLKEKGANYFDKKGLFEKQHLPIFLVKDLKKNKK